MWQGEGAKFDSSGYYFHPEPSSIMLGAGLHTFSKNLLGAYREAMVDPVTGPAIVEAVQEVSVRGGYQLGGEHYNRAPRGYDLDHPHAELLRYNGLTEGRELQISEDFYSAAFLDYSYHKYDEMYIILHWLQELAKELTDT